MAPAGDPETIGAQVAAIDVEERLQRVKLAAGRSGARPGGQLLLAAGSACAAATVVLTYLWWRNR